MWLFRKSAPVKDEESSDDIDLKLDAARKRAKEVEEQDAAMQEEKERRIETLNEATNAAARSTMPQMTPTAWAKMKEDLGLNGGLNRA